MAVRADDSDLGMTGPRLGRAGENQGQHRRDSAMEEQRRMEMQRRLQDEEQARRMREGNEEMRAQHSREAGAERGSGLTPEEDRRRSMESGGEQRMHERGERLERPGTGEYFTTGMDVSREGGIGPSEQAYGERGRQERASTGEYFTAGPDLSRGGGAQRAPEREQRMERPGTGEYFTTGMDVSREGGLRPTDQVYGEPGKQERASSGSYFSGGPEIREREGQLRMTGEERAPAMDRTYRAGTGSMYRPDQPPLERASTGEYFTSGPEPTGQAPRQTPAEYYGREAEQPPSRQAPTERVKGMAASVTSTAKGATQAVSEKLGTAEGREQVSSTAVSKGKEVSHMVTAKAREFNESNRAEDVAARAGETIGKALRKTISVAKGMSSGLRKGMSSEEQRRGESMEGQEMAPRGERETVERESTTREYPQGEERRYQEVRRREQQ